MKKSSAIATAAVCIASIFSVPSAPAQTLHNPPITWEECPRQVANENAKCGRIEVPMNYAEPEGKKISVGFVTVSAKNQASKRGTLFTNSGGPGGDVYGYTANDKAWPWPQEIRAEWDMVGVQPRGLIGSTPVECADANPSDVGQLFNMGGVVRDACNRPNPGNIDHLTTENTARDWEEVRKALGLGTISIMGLSYGTVLGSVYATKYPQHTDKVVLDSGVGPEFFWAEIFEKQRTGYIQNLHEFFAWVAANDAVYHLGTTPYEVYEKWAAKVSGEVGLYPSVAPPQPGTQLQVSIQNFVSQLINPGGVQGASPTLQQSFTLAPRTENWWVLASHLNGSLPASTQQPDEAAVRAEVNRQEMQWILLCNESNTAPRRQELPAFAWNAFVKKDIFDSHLMYSSGAACHGFPPVTTVPDLDGSALKVRPLQIQGLRDPQTPLEMSHSMRERMNSQFVTVNSLRHGHVGLRNKAVDDVVINYLRTGEVTEFELPGETIPTGP